MLVCALLLAGPAARAAAPVTGGVGRPDPGYAGPAPSNPSPSKPRVPRTPRPKPPTVAEQDVGVWR